MPPGQDRKLVRPDLVGRVTVRGDAVAAHDHGVDHPARHGKPGRRVGDEPDVDARPGELPCRQPRALEHGSRLRGDHVGLEARVLERVDHTERRAVAAGRQPSCVAMGQDAAPAGEQPQAMCADRIAGRLVLGVNPQRLREHRLADLGRAALAPLSCTGGAAERRGQVHGRGTDRADLLLEPDQSVQRPDTSRRPVLVESDHEPVGARNPDGRSSADGERRDRVLDVGNGRQARFDERLGQPALVDDHHRTVVPPDGRHVADAQARSATRERMGQAPGWAAESSRDSRHADRSAGRVSHGGDRRLREPGPGGRAAPRRSDRSGWARPAKRVQRTSERGVAQVTCPTLALDRCMAYPSSRASPRSRRRRYDTQGRAVHRPRVDSGLGGPDSRGIRVCRPRSVT